MSTPAKVGIFLISFLTLFVIYVLTSGDGIGSFQKIQAAGEINQSITVYVDRSAGFERDENGNVVSFYAKDNNGERARISSHEPITPDIANAEVVELFGHMHGNNFIANRISIEEFAKD